MNPEYPVYIVSKARWERCLTARALLKIKVPFYIIVEEQEYDLYKTSFPEVNILKLPQQYKDDYDVFWNDDDSRTGPGPARNFAWDHSISNNFKAHWVMDDNIDAFMRYNYNLKVRCSSGTIFKIMETFFNRYDNLAQAGPNYAIFCPASDGRPPIKFNTRIYSCLLMRNDVPHRWRGRYNEDTDLSLRLMKDGWATVQFNAFLQEKRATQTVNGGNSKEFYDEDGTYLKSKMLADMHPDVAKVAKRFNRWHHQVNYKSFANIDPRLNTQVNDTVNEYGMIRTKL